MEKHPIFKKTNESVNLCQHFFRGLVPLLWAEISDNVAPDRESISLGSFSILAAAFHHEPRWAIPK